MILIVTTLLGAKGNFRSVPKIEPIGFSGLVNWVSKF